MTQLNNSRVMVLVAAVLVILLACVSRLGYLQLLKHDFFVNMSQKHTQKSIPIYAKRGRIYDRAQRPLAISEAAYSIYATPLKISDTSTLATALAPILGKTRDQVQKILSQNEPFVWVERKASVAKKEAIEALDLDGIHFIYEEKRLYPQEHFAADVLGFVGTDSGLGGLEYSYNDILRGSKGRIVIDSDPRGRILVQSDRKVLGTPKGFVWGPGGPLAESFDGQQLHTTIDSYIQYVAEKYLDQAVDEFEAISGKAIVMDPYTGDILAMADSPDFDPNKFWDAPAEVRKNSCVVDVFEPGSTFKILTLAAYINEYDSPLSEIIEVPETLELYGHTIKESHGRPEDETDEQTLSDILKKSLNVGTTLLAQELGKETMDYYIRRFGFGQRYQIGLPGESAGLYRPINQWSGVDIAMHSFGQGIGVTALQLAAMTAAIANGGELIQPRILQYVSDFNQVSVQGIETETIHRVISEDTAAKVTEAMVDVVQNGTGRPAAVPGYLVGGKTGTAQKALDSGLGYSETDYITSFMGFLPADDPKVVIVVSIDSPKKSKWGSTVAGPVFRNIGREVMRHMGVLPDFEKTGI